MQNEACAIFILAGDELASVPDSGLSLSILIRWLHFLFGITWIGLLYFLNLVNVRFAASLDASIRPTVMPPLLTRVLAWFRHSAWLTAVTLTGILELPAGRPAIAEAHSGTHSAPGTDPALPSYPRQSGK